MDADVLERFTGKSRLDASDLIPAEQESIDDFASFGFLRGVRDRALYLELRYKTGNATALGYAWIERIEFNPSVGITLHALGQQVIIRGRNLNAEIRPGLRLFQAMLRHRVPWIQEADEPMAMQAGAKDVVIDRIDIAGN